MILLCHRRYTLHREIQFTVPTYANWYGADSPHSRTRNVQPTQIQTLSAIYLVYYSLLRDFMYSSGWRQASPWVYKGTPATGIQFIRSLSLCWLDARPWTFTSTDTRIFVSSVCVEFFFSVNCVSLSLWSISRAVLLTLIVSRAKINFIHIPGKKINFDGKWTKINRWRKIEPWRLGFYRLILHP